MYEEPIIHPNGIWEGFVEVDQANCFDDRLCAELCQFFSDEKAKSVIDFGCGTGDYVRMIRNQSSIICDGIDGNPYTPALSKGICRIQDLSIPFELAKTYDWGLSLEVGEHIPKQSEEIFIDNLIRHAEKGIVISWAIQGQGGFGHINEQSNHYIKELFLKKGWLPDIYAENRLRKSHNPIYFWFKDTIMVFRNPNTK